MALYFAYGSNMRSARLVDRIGPVRPLGVACAEGWLLRFDKPGRDGSGKANLVSWAGSRVWGVVYAIPEDRWSRLDRFEPGYRRAPLHVAPAVGAAFEALSYLYPSAPEAPAIAPSDDYLAQVLAGASEHGLPEHWIETIRSAARER